MSSLTERIQRETALIERRLDSFSNNQCKHVIIPVLVVMVVMTACLAVFAMRMSIVWG